MWACVSVCVGGRSSGPGVSSSGEEQNKWDRFSWEVMAGEPEQSIRAWKWSSRCQRPHFLFIMNKYWCFSPSGSGSHPAQAQSCHTVTSPNVFIGAEIFLSEDRLDSKHKVINLWPCANRRPVGGGGLRLIVWERNSREGSRCPVGMLSSNRFSRHTDTDSC